MTKRSDLEIQQYVAAKETMVKDQVDIVVLIADGDPFLPGFVIDSRKCTNVASEPI